MKRSRSFGGILSGILSLAMAVDAALGAPRHRNQTEAERQEEIELLKELDNPFSKLIRINIRNDWDFGVGLAKAMRYTATLNPVIPFSLNDEWSLFVRMTVPMVYAEPALPGMRAKTGLGNIGQTFYLSPKKTTERWIWGVGPSFLYPSASEHGLGAEKWAAGPSLAVLQQRNRWTYGVLVNHLWSFAGESSGKAMNATSAVGFVSHITKRLTSFQVSTGSVYDWRTGQQTVPVEISTTQILKAGKQDMSISLGGRYYAEKAAGGPDWSLNFTVALLFPK